MKQLLMLILVFVLGFITAKMTNNNHVEAIFPR